MIWFLLFLILFAILTVLSFDYFELIKNWFGRIKIGQHTDDGQWEALVENTVLKWARYGSPQVPLNENKKLRIIDIVHDKMNSVVPSVSYWQDAPVLKAVSMMNTDGFDFNSFVERYIDIETGEWLAEPTRIDCAKLCYEMLCCDGIDNNSIKPALDYVAKMLNDLAEKYGTIPYNENVSNYRFVDTVGMICPFLIKYGLTFGESGYIDIALNQIKDFAKKGIDEKTLLPFHCYDERNSNKLGICGWGRGCAWWAYGVTESLKVLIDSEEYNSDKVFLLRQAVTFFDEMKKYFHNDGSLGRVVLDENSLQDNSASSMLGYCFEYLHGLTENEDYSAVVKSITEHLKFSTRRNGVVDYSQGDTMGIGFYSDGLSVVPATQGFTACIIEMTR